MAVSEGQERLIGKRLGAYRIDALLGEGAMGEVYRGVHEALGRPVAIKTLKPHVAADRSLCERFFAEARAVNIIRHENIVECTDLVNEPGSTYIVMEMLEGRTLGAAIREAGRLPARRAARIAAQIADAIAAAHDKGIVHRDLKPDNVFLIRRAGNPDYVKVLDFGIARLRPDLGAITATQTGALIGTPAYMSPEQVSGLRAGPSADIYALGVILYQMLSGRLPFEAPSVPLILAAHVTNDPAPLAPRAPEAPAPLVALVARCLAKQPPGRPADMATFRREVLEAVGLPVEEQASMISAGAAAGPAGPASRAPVSSADAFDATAAPVSGVAETGAAGIPATRAPTPVPLPRAAGSSSVSGAAGQVTVRAEDAAPAAAAAGRSRLPLIVGGGVALALGGVLVVALGGGGGGAGRGGAGGVTPDASLVPSTALAVPTPADAAVELPGAQPALPATPPAPSAATGPADAGPRAPAGKPRRADAGTAAATPPPAAGVPDAAPRPKDLTKELIDDEDGK